MKGEPMRAAIGLGSNIGDRLGNLRQAVTYLIESRFSLCAASSVFETPPFGRTDQPPFLNAAVVGQFEGKPRALLNLLKDIERRIGRQDRGRWGPREIDLDLLLIPDLVYRDDQLEIPHPGLAIRAFALVPLAEIAPRWIHPVLGVEIADLAERFEAEAKSFLRITRL
ncbi:MAG: 2-amino-4-hydroxy-6-hydroxymethyldihydropteridine diphosphokinase [Synergistales bacterium]|jgi:2-amino-4-hydroxy-6-hydroxymethyldihydropteridine diphosphokinase